MAREIGDLVSFVVELENLITERDEWANAFSLYTLKKSVLRQFGQPGEELQQALQDLDYNAMQAESLLNGVTEELSDFVGTADPEEARSLLIKLKSLLNAYAETTGRTFRRDAQLDDKSPEELVSFAYELIKND